MLKKCDKINLTNRLFCIQIMLKPFDTRFLTIKNHQEFFDDAIEVIDVTFTSVNEASKNGTEKINQFVDEILTEIHRRRSIMPPQKAFPPHLERELLTMLLYQSALKNDEGLVAKMLASGAHPLFEASYLRVSGLDNPLFAATLFGSDRALSLMLDFLRKDQETYLVEQKTCQNLIEAHFAALIEPDDHASVHHQNTHDLIMRELSSAPDGLSPKLVSCFCSKMTSSAWRIDEHSNLKKFSSQKIKEFFDVFHKRSAPDNIQVQKAIETFLTRVAIGGASSAHVITALMGMTDPLEVIRQYAKQTKHELEGFENPATKKLSKKHLVSFEIMVEFLPKDQLKSGLGVIRRLKGWDRSPQLLALSQSIQLDQELAQVVDGKSTSSPIRKM